METKTESKVNLTDEELDVAICEWRGWTEIGSNGFGFSPVRLLKYGVAHKQELPSHILGIEALGNMHEAEKELDSPQSLQYAELLRESTRQNEASYWRFYFVTATARQRAIALLRVVKPELFQ